MWFADTGLGLAWIILTGWVLVAGLAATVGRTAMSTVVPRSARVPLLVGTAAAVVLFATQAGLATRSRTWPGPGCSTSRCGHGSWATAHPRRPR